MSDLTNRLRAYAAARRGELADLITEAADALANAERDSQRVESVGMRWIPCAERLPKERQMVIVTIRGHDLIRCDDGETLEEAIDRVMQMLRVSVGFRDEDGWNGAGGYPMMVQPVAWMPLPEPWKGEE